MGWLYKWLKFPFVCKRLKVSFEADENKNNS